VKLRASIALVTVVGFLACQTTNSKSVSLTRYTIEDLYSVSLPDNLRKARDMHDYASLQYNDPQTDFYVLGIDDPKDKLGRHGRKLKMDVYYQFVEQTVLEPADSVFQMASRTLKQEGAALKLADYYAKTQHFDDEYELFYRIAVFENETHFFQLVIWMPFENHCERIKWVDAITQSFEMLPPQSNREIADQ
jgi:hypothetical protein